MNQEAFAERLKVAQGVVSAWERGEYAPKDGNFVQLAMLATEHDLLSEALWFFQQAGLGRAELLAAAAPASGGPEWNKAYSAALIDAQAEYPNDSIARHRMAMGVADRVMRIKASRKAEQGSERK